MKKILFVSIYSILIATGYSQDAITVWNGGVNSSFIPPTNNSSVYSRQALNATINVNYIGTDWTPESKAAFEYAVQIWQQVISSEVDITIDTEFKNLADPNTIGQTFTYRAANFTPTANNSSFFEADFYYPLSLANKLHGAPVNGQVNMKLEWNTDFSFYFGTDGQSPNTKMDFVTIALHEIGHGLGFVKSVSKDLNNNFSFKFGTGSNAFPYIYEKFVVNGTGSRLTNQATSGTALANYVQSNDLYFDGAKAKAANNNQPIELYAPSSFANGSSIAHFGQSLNSDNDNKLMTYSTGYGPGNHAIGHKIAGVLEDIGWDETFPIATGLNQTTQAGEILMRFLDPVLSQSGAVQYSITENGTTYHNQPNFIIELDQNYNYNCSNFFSGPSNTDFRLIALHKNGSYLVDRSATHTFTYVDNILPDDLEWLRDQDGNVKGYLEYIENVAQDTPPTLYGRMSVRFEHKPNKPEILITNTAYSNQGLYQQKPTVCDEMKLSFVANGSDFYSVTYQETGDPFTAVTIGVPTGKNSVIISGLDENKSYDFSVYASNSNGGITSETYTRGKCKLRISVIDYTSINDDRIRVREFNNDATIKEVEFTNILNPTITKKETEASGVIEKEINIDDLPNGIYDMKVKDIDGNESHKLIQKQ